MRIKLIFIGMALAVLAFPINTASGKEPQPFVFERGQYPAGPYQFGEKPEKQSAKTVSKARKLTKPTYNPCSCVSYARFITGINVGPIGVARNHPVNSKNPIIGAILITYESRLGHASVVTGFDEKFVYVNEANYSRCRVTYNRAIRLDSALIKGYYK